MRESISVIAVGDLSFNGGYRRILKKKGPSYPFQRVTPLWNQADLRFGNLESPITSCARVAPAKFTLRGAPQAVDALRAARIDAVSLANNHMMDFGGDGLLETCRRLDAAGIAHVGAGQNLEQALAPRILDRNGLRVGVLAFCDVAQVSSLYATESAPGVAPFALQSCLESVERLRPQVDWLIVHLHWGEEMSQLPTPSQRTIAAQLAAAGVDLLLGHHSHVIQPLERIDNMVAAYSLGDFLFSTAYWRGTGGSGKQFLGYYDVHPLSRKTAWLHVTLLADGTSQTKLCPAWLERNLQVVPTADKHAEQLQQRFQTLVSEQRLEAELEEERKAAHIRERWRLSGRRWTTRLKLNLLRCGLLRNAYVEPDNTGWR